jgi:hypothetical protein
MKEISGKPVLWHPASIIVLSFFLSTFSCAGGQAGSLVILDPVLPVMAPDAAAVISRYGRKAITLPFEASEVLYSAIAEEKPAVLFLSPLLAPEINRILDSTPGIRIVHAGSARLPSRDGLYSASFSSADAAGRAGTVLADKARTLPQNFLCIGIFMNGSEEAIRRFTDAYLAGKPGNEPIIENITTPWSVALASKLRGLDVRLAYIAVPGKDAARWAREVFPGSSYVLLESAFGDMSDPAVDAMLVWDIDSSLELLVSSLDAAASASIGGIWRLHER